MRRHLGPLTRFCAKFLGNVRSGEEVAQDALVEIWSRRRVYRPGRFRVFLFRVARNRCLNRLRDEGRRGAVAVPSSQVDELETGSTGDVPPDPLDQLIDQERRRRARAELVKLAPKLREAVLLRFDQGLEYRDIARIVGRPEVTVRSRVFHALRRLREALTTEDDG